jgi:sterol desaturase/sphingolipid hydroxylase (fatty acid hydroxylase superfamily)
MFNHANLRLPAALDRVLRWFVVTPTCTASTIPSGRETNSNFGFNLPWWDRLFGTYRAQPGRPRRHDHRHRQFRTPRVRLDGC